MKLFILVFFSFIGCFSHGATEGQWTHGGDPIIASVHAEIRAIEKGLAELPQFLHSYENIAQRYTATYKGLKIQVKPDLVWKGQSVAAINSPYANPQVLEISEKRWVEMNSYEKEALLLHEFMFLIGLDDTDYNHSQFIQQILNFNRDGDLRGLLESSVAQDQFYSNLPRWILFFEKIPVRKYDGELALEYIVEQYSNSAEWLRAFEIVLKFTPLKECNLIAAQALLTLMFYEDTFSKFAQDKMMQRGFRLNPSLSITPNLCTRVH